MDAWHRDIARTQKIRMLSSLLLINFVVILEQNRGKNVLMPHFRGTTLRFAFVR